jgi:GAF domain-containing protein
MESRERVSGFAELARRLRSAESPQHLLDRVVELAVEAVPGCEHAGIMIVRRGRTTSAASSDELPELVDKVQEQTQQGPCLDAAGVPGSCYSPDLTGEQRWPEFARRAVRECGVRSLASFRLFVEEETYGSLSLYAPHAHAFDAEALDLGAVFATHAALALSAAYDRQQAAQYADALNSNRDIGTAMGILMARHGVNAQAAIEHLRTTSQRQNRKLRDVAAEVTYTGELP